ncbi:hypothetical protein AAH029_14460 [Parabacteroides distasonis]|uniref:hypothetical protein n=1 Tax=Parabacteroides distasonis TaxID=823 RepID=UPI0039B364B1
MRIILVIILYIGLISACTQKPVYPEAMSQAIRCVETQPDSALLYLDSILPSTLQAEPEDSTIQEIVRFYDKYGDLHKQMEAYYYLGSVYRDAGRRTSGGKGFPICNKTWGKDERIWIGGESLWTKLCLARSTKCIQRGRESGKKRT